MARLRSSLTYANVVASLALFVALSTGGAWAAARLIDGRQIKPSTITGKQVKNGSLTARDLKRGTLTASPVPGPAGAPGKDGAVGPQGAPGKDGAAGAPGAAGPSDASIMRSRSYDVPDLATYSPALRLDVPVAGDWIFDGHVELANASQAATVTGDCRLAAAGAVLPGDGDVQGSATGFYSSAGGLNYSITAASGSSVSFTATASFASPGTFELQCRRTSGSGSLFIENRTGISGERVGSITRRVADETP